MTPSSNVRPFQQPRRAAVAVEMPNDFELEADVLGAILSIDGGTRHLATLEDGCFFDANHQQVFKASYDLMAEGKPASTSNVAARLKRTVLDGLVSESGATGRGYLAELASRGAGMEIGLTDAIAQLWRLFYCRTGIQSGQELIARCLNPDDNPEESMSACERRLREGMASGAGGSLRERREVIAAAIDERLNAGEVFSTGIKALDVMTGGGARVGQMVTVEARSGAGKTALMASTAASLAAQGAKVLVFCLESTPEDYETRMLACWLNVTQGQMLDSGDLGHAKLEHNRDHYLDNVPDNIVYCELDRPTLKVLHREILRAKFKFGVTHVIIDAFQNIGGRADWKGPVEEFNKEVAKGLRSIMKRERINIWQTSQVDAKAFDALWCNSTIYLRVTREENDFEMHFEVMKNTDGVAGTMATTTARSTCPSIVLDPAGPHVRDAKPEDMSRASQRDVPEGGGAPG